MRPDDTENRAINRRGCFQRTGGSVVKEKWGTKKRGRRKTHQPLSGRARTHAGWEVRGGRLGDEVTSQTQAIQSIANMSWCFVLSLPTDGDGVNLTCT